MNKKANKLVPKLRFPEFRESEEWEKRTIGQISDSVTAGGTPSTSEKAYWNGSIRWMNSGELNYKKVYEVQGRITGEGLRNSSTKIIPKMCVLIGLAGQGKTRGTVAMNMVELCINQSIAAIFPNEKKYSSDFLYHNLDNRYDELRSLSAGGEGRGGLNLQIIKSMGVPLPHIIEQQKIADCLSSIDDLINAQSQKVEALKTHKKGLMQQLFPREGETVPRLRFPEFRDAGEWEEKPLKKVFSIFQGFAFSSCDSAPHGVRWLKIADVSIQQMNHDAPSYLPLEHKDQYQKFSVHKGDYVLALTRPILSGELKMAPIDDVFHGALLNQRVGKLVTDQNISFVYYLLQTSKLISNIDKSISGSEPPNLSAQQIEDLKTRIPLGNEQQKIADCLSSIDQLISTESQKIEALKVHKKGLVQQLFPMVSEEV